MASEKDPRVLIAMAFALASAGRDGVNRVLDALADRDRADDALAYLVELGQPHVAAVAARSFRVLAQACRQAAAWEAGDLQTGLVVSVNVAARQVREPGLVDVVATVLAETGLPPELLQLELTESALMGTPDGSLAVLHTLAGMGVCSAASAPSSRRLRAASPRPKYRRSEFCERVTVARHDLADLASCRRRDGDARATASRFDCVPTSSTPSQCRLGPTSFLAGHGGRPRRRRRCPATPRFQKSATAMPRLLKQVGAGGAADLEERAVRRCCAGGGCAPSRARTAAEVLGVEEGPVLYALWSRHHVVEEVELDLGVPVVVDPAVGGVDVLPAVVVESAKPEPQNQPTGLAPAFQVTSSNVPSPRLRSSVLPEAICWKTRHERSPTGGRSRSRAACRSSTPPGARS